MADETTYRPDYRGTAGLMSDPEMAAAVQAITEAAIPFAKAIAPDAPPYGVGYLDHFAVNMTTQRIAGARRATAELYNDARYATAVELGRFGDTGSRDTGHHTMSRVADHIERG